MRELFLPENGEARLRELPKAGVGAWCRIRLAFYGRPYGSTVLSCPQDIDTWGKVG